MKSLRAILAPSSSQFADLNVALADAEDRNSLVADSVKTMCFTPILGEAWKVLASRQRDSQSLVQLTALKARVDAMDSPSDLRAQLRRDAPAQELLLTDSLREVCAQYGEISAKASSYFSQAPEVMHDCFNVFSSSAVSKVRRQVTGLRSPPRASAWAQYRQKNGGRRGAREERQGRDFSGAAEDAFWGPGRASNNMSLGGNDSQHLVV